MCRFDSGLGKAVLTSDDKPVGVERFPERYFLSTLPLVSAEPPIWGIKRVYGNV